MNRSIRTLVCVGNCLLLLAACGRKDTAQEGAVEPFPISILTTSFTADPVRPDNKLWKMLEQYTGTKLNIIWTPNASYNDKINITLSSGNLPMILKVENTKVPSVANGIKAAAFWEIGPYLKDYPNLNQADPAVLRNISTDGKIYGIYRARQPNRIGISFRKDWLNRLGLQEPRTIDDFYHVLKAFTFDDPDGNGSDDTYGLAVSKYPLPWDVMQLWFGASNKWGEGPDGRLVPDHMTKGYREALHFFRKLYEEKLVNPDFPISDPTRWNDQIVNGHAGVMVDVADTAGRLESSLAKSDPKAVIDVIGAVEGPLGLRNLTTAGYSGVFLISKSEVKTEGDLKKVLHFLDQLNDLEMQRLLGYGIEGIHYTVKEGRLSVFESSRIPAEYKLNDLGQLLMMIPDRTATLFKPATALREKVSRILEENKKMTVPNPAEPLESYTYQQKGTQLDLMIEEARIQYIVGKLDEAGFDAAVDKWRSSGGDAYIGEINEAYAKLEKHPQNP